MKVRILGCGTSLGVPVIGLGWGDCDPNNSKNVRRRASVLVSKNDQNLLIDTSPDLRAQLLEADVTTLEGVLYTHEHADHVHGVNDLRPFALMEKKPVKLYSNKHTLDDIRNSFEYAFTTREGGRYPPIVKPEEITPWQRFKVGGFDILPFEQRHGLATTLGYRIGDFAYSTDTNALSDRAFEILSGVKVWVVDCLRKKGKHPSHAHLNLSLEWIERVKPERAYLTHMNNTLDYDWLIENLPKGVEPAYDGLEIEV